MERRDSGGFGVAGDNGDDDDGCEPVLSFDTKVEASQECLRVFSY